MASIRNRSGMEPNAGKPYAGSPSTGEEADLILHFSFL
jgi:hypothetical protein